MIERGCKKFKLSIKDFLLLNYTFMCMIIFLRIIIQVSKVTKPAFLARVWEWRGICTDCPDVSVRCMTKDLYFILQDLSVCNTHLQCSASSSSSLFDI